MAHINQRGGAFRESAHENIRGRERQLREMADAVRRLIHITATNIADPETTASAAAELHALADRLEPLVPAEAPPRYAFGESSTEPHDFFQYDPVLGLYNPLALPVEMTWEPPRAVGRAHFTTPYEGPPGCVHGAVLAGVFDQVFNVANLMNGTAGPTRELTLRYKRPTPLHHDLVFEAWVEEVDEKQILTLGHVRVGDTIAVEARGTFAIISVDRIMELGESARRGGGNR